ncbi:MAG: RagB/SusD family nutrient uptake outer membrane protein [Parabacteroides sp.]|nr:RagB/SusD family nutrient uptake outer membrane protein [Parabacteroides sp.]
MKTPIRNSVLAYALAAILGSCNMDVVPPAEISAPSYWKTDKDAWYALNSCYEKMKGLDIWDEMCTDNAHSHKPWEGNFELVQQNGISTAAPYGDYNFEAVRRANTFIDNVDKCEMSDDMKGRMKAEARFFRAFSYLELTQYFGKVAIITEAVPYDAPNMPRNSVEEVHAFILDELAEIATLLPESYPGGYLNETGRITRYAALALRARAALYFGNYTEAEKSAREVIDSKKYALFRIASLDAAQQQEADEMDLYVDFTARGIDKDAFVKGMFSYEALWHGANASPANKEYVLTHEYMADANANDAYRYTYFIPLDMSIKDGYSSYEPMQDLIDAYWSVDGKTIPTPPTVDQRKMDYEKIWNHAKDLDKTAYKKFATGTDLMTYEYMKEFKNRDSRLYVSFMFPFKGWHGSPVGEHYYRWDPSNIDALGNFSWTGFSYRKMVSVNPYNQSASPDDYPTIRYAEVLLTFAEAHLMNTGYDKEVRDALNDIRDRCGMPDVPAALSKDAAIDLLRNERRIELAGEGHRFDDVRRYGSTYCQHYLNGPSTAPNGHVVITKVWDDRLLLMPIPTSAIDTNPLLKDDQNPGY